MIEEAISRKQIKYFEYSHFEDFQEIGRGSFGKVYRVNRKNQYLALKSLINLDNVAMKEVIHEVIINYKIYLDQ